MRVLPHSQTFTLVCELEDPGSSIKLLGWPWGSHYQPHLPHKVVVWTEGKKELCTSPRPPWRKGGIKMWKNFKKLSPSHVPFKDWGICMAPSSLLCTTLFISTSNGVMSSGPHASGAKYHLPCYPSTTCYAIKNLVEKCISSFCEIISVRYTSDLVRVFELWLLHFGEAFSKPLWGKGHGKADKGFFSSHFCLYITLHCWKQQSSV